MSESGSSAVTRLADDLRRVPPSMRPELRRVSRDAGQSVRDRAASNASWSRRIPRALSIRTTFGQNTAGVTIVASSARAPHARVYEGLVQPVFRHPVFGRRTWVAERARPYLYPAVVAEGSRTVVAIADAVDRALRQHNL